MNPLLSICIPTYNRAPFLKKCLNQLAEQLNHTILPIEVLVSDNGSPDETQNVVSEASKSFHNNPIRCFLNATNEGVEKNLLKLGHLAIGKYLWLMGDDDEFLPGALVSVIRYIEEGNQLVICNWIDMINKSLLSTKSLDFGNSSDLHFSHPNDLMNKLLFHVSFMSSLVFLRDWFLNFSSFGLETKFPQVYIVYRGMLEPNCRAVLTYSPLIIHRIENDSDFGNRKWLNILSEDPPRIARKLLEDGYSKKSIRLLSTHVVIGWIVILFEKMNFFKKLKTFPIKKIAKNFKPSIDMYLKIYMFLFLPKKTLSLARAAKKKLT